MYKKFLTINIKNIINTFLERYDFKGKDIIVWGTSHNSNFWSEVISNLRNICKEYLIQGIKEHQKSENVNKFIQSLK